MMVPLDTGSPSLLPKEQGWIYLQTIPEAALPDPKLGPQLNPTPKLPLGTGGQN